MKFWKTKIKKYRYAIYRRPMVANITIGSSGVTKRQLRHIASRVSFIVTIGVISTDILKSRKYYITLANFSTKFNRDFITMATLVPQTCRNAFRQVPKKCWFLWSLGLSIWQEPKIALFRPIKIFAIYAISRTFKGY